MATSQRQPVHRNQQEPFRPHPRCLRGERNSSLDHSQSLQGNISHQVNTPVTGRMKVGTRADSLSLLYQYSPWTVYCYQAHLLMPWLCELLTSHCSGPNPSKMGGLYLFLVVFHLPAGTIPKFSGLSSAVELRKMTCLLLGSQ